LKISIALFLSGMLPLLLFYFLASKSYLVIEKFIPQIETVFPELVKEMNTFYENIRIQFILVFLLTFILIIFYSVLYGRYVINSINKLIKGADKIIKGNYDVKVNIKTKDELETLGDVFNQMAKELKEKTRALEEEKASLEVKVKARTKELEELTQSLDEKVKARTKELQERINQLERFQKLTIGRELKMVELKKEIENLKKELEELKKKKR